ncbi:MAG: OmpA family protein [Nevskia sp.]|nr:OmpA family protein [Nevskia sp.]
MRRAGRILAAAAALLLAACATPDRIVLLPDDQGKVGKLNVHGSAGGDTLLNSAYDTATVSGGKAQRSTGNAQDVNKDFGGVLATLPQAPVAYTFYFLVNSDDLTPESKALAPAILAEIARRPAAEVVVIGHTDAQGSDDYNDKLSLQRAQAVKQQLIALGFDAARIAVAGRGKREPLIPTAEGVPEPRNRRAEVLVR